MRVRTPRSLPVHPALLALTALLSGVAPAAADERSSAVPASPAAPPAVAPSATRHAPLRLRAMPPTMGLSAAFPAQGRAPAAADVSSADIALPASRSERMKRAFAAEMREEAITSRRAALYATIPEALPELLEDDYIRKQQSRMAESVIGDAVEAAVSEGFFGNRHTTSALNIRPLFAVADHGFKLDASPSWTYRVKAPRSGFHVDVPLIPSTIRVNAYRELNGTNRTPMRLGGGILVDPFDEEVRVGVSLKF